MHLLHVVRSADSRRTHYCVDPTRRVLNFTQDTTNEQITTRLSAPLSRSFRAPWDSGAGRTLQAKVPHATTPLATNRTPQKDSSRSSRRAPIL